VEEVQVVLKEENDLESVGRVGGAERESDLWGNG